MKRWLERVRHAFERVVRWWVGRRPAAKPSEQELSLEELFSGLVPEHVKRTFSVSKEKKG